MHSFIDLYYNILTNNRANGHFLQHIPKGLLLRFSTFVLKCSVSKSFSAKCSVSYLSVRVWTGMWLAYPWKVFFVPLILSTSEHHMRQNHAENEREKTVRGEEQLLRASFLSSCLFRILLFFCPFFKISQEHLIRNHI